LSHFSVTPPPKAEDRYGDDEILTAGPPLVFRGAQIRYDPSSEEIAERAFSGFFEVGTSINWVSFWFKNPHPFSVKMAMRGRSCTSCTSAKAAIVPEAALHRQAEMTTLSALLPWSPVPLPDILSPVGYTLEQNNLTWHAFDFDNPNATFTVPAASDNRPAVGVLALGFLAKAPSPPTMIDATLEMVGPDERPHYHKFHVIYAPRPPFDVLPNQYAVGDLSEGVPSRTFDVVVYSSTRNPNEFPPPIGRVGGDDPFLSIGQPVPFSEADRNSFAQLVAEETKSPIRVRAAYRVPVTVYRDLPNRQADVGTFDRTVHFSLPGTTHTAAVHFRGRVTGLVKLEKGDKIDLGSYNSAYNQTMTAKIFSDRSDLELELDLAGSTPAFAQYALRPLPSEGSRKYWEIKVTIPAKQGRKPAWEGVVFLKAKVKDGPPINVRLPITGNGISR
jgi:hypothetical protein